MNKNNNKMDLLGNAPVPQALMALGIPSRSAFHRSRVRAYVAGPSSEFVREITASGLRSGFTTQATDYYYGMVTNLSSDAFTIKSFSITF